jgi:hypothetical protein
MSTINLTVYLNDLNSKQVNALSNFISSFSGDKSVNTEEYTPSPGLLGQAINIEQPAPEEKKKRAPRGSKAQAGAFEGQERTESVADEYQAAKEAPVTDATDAEDNDIMGDDSPKLTFDDLRAVTSTKTQADRANVDLLRAKIKELGGEKLVDLQSKPLVWQEFIDYANSL